MASSTGGKEPMKNAKRMRNTEYRADNRKTGKPQRGGKEARHSDDY